MSNKSSNTIKSLHDALDAYEAWIRSSSGDILPPIAHNRIAVVNALRAAHDDLPLSSLGIERCKEMVDYWRNRPDSNKGRPLALSTCKDRIAHLIRFLYWLDHCDHVAWQLPQRIDRIDKKVRRLASDNQHKQIGLPNLEQLGLLYRHGDKLDRLMLCLSLNCGLSPADLGRLECDNVVPADQLTGNDSVPDGHAILRVASPMTRQYGEYALWPETHALLNWAIERAQELHQSTVFVKHDGSPMFRAGSQNPSQAFTRRFNRLQHRIRKGQPDFNAIPLKTLRRAGADLIRRVTGGEVAALYLRHVPRRASDMFVPRFDRLHTALIEMRNALQPVFSGQTTPVKESERTADAKNDRSMNRRSTDSWFIRQIGGRKFRLGRCELEAVKRDTTLRKLWQLVMTTTGHNQWTPFAKVVATHVANGQISLTFHDESEGGAE